MTQSVCSRCIKPLTEAEKRRHTMLCTLCEPAWEMAFEHTMSEFVEDAPEHAAKDKDSLLAHGTAPTQG